VAPERFNCCRGRFGILKLFLSHLVAVLFFLPAVSLFKKDMFNGKSLFPIKIGFVLKTFSEEFL